MDICGEWSWCLKLQLASWNPEGVSLRTNLDPNEGQLESALQAYDNDFELLDEQPWESTQGFFCVKQ